VNKAMFSKLKRPKTGSARVHQQASRFAFTLALKTSPTICQLHLLPSFKWSQFGLSFQQTRPIGRHDWTNPQFASVSFNGLDT
jgi:hypothetical protein